MAVADLRRERLSADSRVTGDRGEPRPTYPVSVWALIGGIALVAEAYVIIKWISGPYFTTVHSGPDSPPEWMKVGINLAQVILWPLAIVILWRLLVRPWRRERRLSSEGLICLGLLSVSIYDPVSNYLHNWLTYNSYFLNFGSIVKSIPGWQSFAKPGQMPAYPILLAPPLYVVGVFGAGWFAYWAMCRVHSRWPTMRTIPLLAITVVGMWLFDVLLEGGIFMRLGWYSGVGWSVFDGGTANAVPLGNQVLAAICFTTIGSILFFKNDQGQTIFERGANTLSPRRSAVWRTLAGVGVAQALMFSTYHIPAILWQGARQSHVPSAISTKSYLNPGGGYFEHTCGTAAQASCPPAGK
jgi:Spirocyclase AveC-like